MTKRLNQKDWHQFFVYDLDKAVAGDRNVKKISKQIDKLLSKIFKLAKKHGYDYDDLNNMAMDISDAGSDAILVLSDSDEEIHYFTRDELTDWYITDVLEFDMDDAGPEDMDRLMGMILNDLDLHLMRHRDGLEEILHELKYHIDNDIGIE